MKILFVTPEYPIEGTTSSGGIGTSLKHLSTGLVAANNQVIILLYGQKNERDFIDNGIRFIQIKNPTAPFISWFLLRLKISKIINRLHKHNEVDIVEFNDWTGISAFMNISPPQVMRLHGTDTMFCDLDGRKVKWKNKFFENKAYRKAQNIIAVSKFVGEQNNRVFKVNKPFKVIPNLVPQDWSERSLHVTESREPVLLYFGTIIRKKGALELPEIFNRVASKNNDVRLIIAGKDAPDALTKQPSTKKMMEEKFNPEFKERVEFTGEIPYHEVKNLIKKTTICLFPSYAEALPMTWIEAMKSGRAIVASDIGWAQEMLTNNSSAFLIHPANHDEWSEKILILLNNNIKRKDFEDNAKIEASLKFDFNRTLDLNIDYYKTVIENGI